MVTSGRNHRRPARGVSAGGPDQSERLKIVLERSGGIVGRTVRRGLDTAELPADQASRLRLLATALTDPASEGHEGSSRSPDGPADEADGRSDDGAVTRPRGPQGADRFVYTIELQTAGQRVVRTFTEPVPDRLRPLLSLLSEAPRLPARPPT